MQSRNIAKEKKKLSVEIYVGGKKVETLTEEQRNRVAERFGKALSLYYSNHPEEYEKV